MMILVDTNILIYAEDSLSLLHKEARQDWDTQLSGESPVSLCWSILTSFIQVSTNWQILKKTIVLKNGLT